MEWGAGGGVAGWNGKGAQCQVWAGPRFLQPHGAEPGLGNEAGRAPITGGRELRVGRVPRTGPVLSRTFGGQGRGPRKLERHPRSQRKGTRVELRGC